MSEVSFVVPGVPAPQGSKTRTKWGVREDNPATRPWRTAVAWEATVAMQGRLPLDGPLALHVDFYFPRPKSHYGSGRNAAELKAAAPLLHSVKPDCDKLLRALADSLSGIVCRDDAQFVVVAARKLYGSPCAEVTVSACNVRYAVAEGLVPTDVVAKPHLPKSDVLF